MRAWLPLIASVGGLALGGAFSLGVSEGGSRARAGTLDAAPFHGDLAGYMAGFRAGADQATRCGRLPLAEIERCAAPIAFGAPITCRQFPGEHCICGRDAVDAGGP